MSKKLILKASVAALLGTAFATSAQADDHASVTFSGVVRAHLYLTDDSMTEAEIDEVTGEITTPAEEVGARFAAGDVRFNIAAENTMDSGLTAFANYRLDADGLNGSTITSDATKLGVKGSFGTITVLDMGAKVEMGELANDIYGTGQGGTGIGYDGAFGPVSVGIAFSPENNDDLVTAGLSFSTGGLTIGAGVNSNDHYSVGAAYSIGGVDLAVQTGNRVTPEGTDEGITAAKIGTSFGAFSTSVNYADSDLLGSTIRLDLGTSITDALAWGMRYQDTDSSSFLRTSLTYSF